MSANKEGRKEGRKAALKSENWSVGLSGHSGQLVSLSSSDAKTVLQESVQELKR